MDTLTRLQHQNLMTVALLDERGTIRRVPPGTPNALEFQVRRVAASSIQSNLLYAVLGRDGYVQYAEWHSAQAAQEKQKADALSAGPETPPPFDDALPDDEHWRAHSLALQNAADDAVLMEAMVSPTFAEAGVALGLYRSALVRAVVEWDRPAPEGDHAGNAWSGNSEPP